MNKYLVIIFTFCLSGCTNSVSLTDEYSSVISDIEALCHCNVNMEQEIMRYEEWGDIPLFHVSMVYTDTNIKSIFYPSSDLDTLSLDIASKIKARSELDSIAIEIGHEQIEKDNNSIKIVKSVAITYLLYGSRIIPIDTSFGGELSRPQVD